MVRRSVLFSPADQPELLRKAPATGADVVVFDMEDGVLPAQKATARDDLRSVLGDIDPECELCVRINPLDSGGTADLDAILPERATVDSIMLPKVSSPEQVRTLRDHLPENDSIPVLALLETAGGILDAPAIAAQEAVDALLLGAEDLAADIGATRTAAGEEVSYARQRVVLAASHAGIDAIDTLVTDFEDTELLRTDTLRAVQFGFDGKMAIHPRQVGVINEIFVPDEDEIDWARRVLAAREDTDGRGVFAVDGEMIDAPLLSQAEQILERARTTTGDE
ncbi:HpcH/HpaI aldolase/citrate lyase family protein [Halobacteriaceae archaeon SHR40]|uniref:HpcH/HpaI aldolase/citrate lyase family protein n=1 Tax=Halovenus amylolytica TaxID=2500550 RepID=UPI000FE2F21B